MTRRLVEIVSSDLSGVEGAETVQVPAFDIDLLPGEKAEMLRLLEPYLQLGRKGGVAAGAPSIAQSRHTTSKELAEDRRQARAWLNSHGYTVGVKGSIKKEYWEAFVARQPATGWVESRPVTPAVTERPPGAVTRIPAARKSQKAMSPAFMAAEADTATVEAVEAPQKAVAPRKTAAPRVGTTRAVKAAVVAGGGVKTAAATKTAPRKTATAKVSRTR